MFVCILSDLFSVFAGLHAAQNTDSGLTPEENAVTSPSAALARITFRTPPERPSTSPNPPLYADLLSQDDSLLTSSSPPTSAALLPRPQAVGSPGHPTPGPIGLGLGLGLSSGANPVTVPCTPYLGNGDGSSSDSLDRQAAGQEDDEEDEDEDEDDEDSSEYENLVSEATHLPIVSASILAQGRPAALSPDGDAHSSETT